MTNAHPTDRLVQCILTAIVAVALLLCPAAAGAQDTADALALRPRWETGQSARYSFWTRRQQDVEVRFDGNVREAGSTVLTEGELSWTIDSVRDDGSAEATMTLDWMTADITDAEGKTLRNDSRKGAGDLEPVHGLLRAMAGAPIRVSLTADGSVASVSGVDKIRAAAEVPEMVPEELDFEESATELATLAFAPETAAVGDTWPASFRWTHELGHLEQDWTYRVAGVEEIGNVRVAMIEGEAELELDPDTLRAEQPADAPPTTVKLVDGEATQSIMFDLSRGEAVGRDSTLRTTLEVSVALPNARKLNQVTREVERSQVLRIEP